MEISRFGFGALALFALLGGCIAPPDESYDVEIEDTEGTEAPIVGGSTATTYPEAVLVDMYQNGSFTSICSGAIIAPKVVLTAGHCVHGFNGWKITAPFAGGQKANSSGAATYDWKVDGQYVDPNYHDIGLVFLSTPINLASYPKLATAGVADGTKVVNVGRINNGVASYTKLFASQPIAVESGSKYGFPYSYASAEVIESGDSGGPDLLAGTHTIVAVNSGGGGGMQVLARVDLLKDWINAQVNANGGFAGAAPAPAPSGASEVEPNDSYTSPNPLSGTLKGNLPSGDEDWFSWSVAASGVNYDVKITPTGDARIQMWKLSGGQYYQIQNTTSTRITGTSSGAGQYVVVAFSPSGQSQSYSMTLVK